MLQQCEGSSEDLTPLVANLLDFLKKVPAQEWTYLHEPLKQLQEHNPTTAALIRDFILDHQTLQSIDFNKLL